jgi:site-specific recombinase XerD
MLTGGWKKAVSARKIMQPEKVAERTIRNVTMAEQYYSRGMRVEDIAKLHGLEISYAYAIIRKTPI